MSGCDGRDYFNRRQEFKQFTSLIFGWAIFPLTPALSLGERENMFPPDTSSNSSLTLNFEL
jgi:hypothetical protein